MLNAKSDHQLAVALGVEMPISQAVYRMLYEGLAPAEVLRSLTGRDLKRE